MQTLPVNFFRITVVFNPANLANPITLTCDDVEPGGSMNGRSLSIPQGISMIGLYLLTLPGGGGEPAVFSSTPITWPGVVGTPEVYMVQSWNSGHVTIVAFNTVRVQTPHQFSVNVTYDGVNYPQDPTIVNEPPMPLG